MSLPSISSLMSPPELNKPLDNFDAPIKPQATLATSRQSSYNEDNILPPMRSTQRSPDVKALKVLPSPPVSPWTTSKNNVTERSGKAQTFKDGGIVVDPVLYPTVEVEKPVVTERLFSSSPDQEFVEQVVDRYMMATHLAQFQGKKNTPTRTEYLLAVTCLPTIGGHYNHNPGAYLKRVREENDEYYHLSKRVCARPGKTFKPVKNIAPAPPPTLTPKQSKNTASANKVAKAVKTPHIRVRRTPKASPKDQFLDVDGTGRLAIPEGRVPGTKRPEDIDYNALTDITPPLSTLPPNNPKSLKVDWPSSNQLDLSADPDRHKLHEAEVNLASTLRLTCATYLCSKRRIFLKRLEAFKVGKEFRKTDAQQACKIDVNKASKLWIAYDKVGWFKPHYLERFL